MNPPEDVSAKQAETKATVRSALQDALALIDSPERAEAVLADLEKAAAGQTEEQQGVAAARQPDDAAQRVAESAHADDLPRTERAAETLRSAAAEAVAPTSEAGAVVEGAREAVGTRGQGTLADESQRLRTGRKHLKDAALRRMAPLQALDARIFLAVNQSPHPRWLDRLADWLAITANGGWLWVIGVGAAGIAGAPQPGRVLVALVPTVAATACVIEYPVKAVFRRRRPFIDVVRALVVGKEPGSWSFPSGHTATAFAAAVVVQGTWPRCGALVYTLAALTGLSRIYVGVHYPGDVAFGAACGLVVGWIFRAAQAFLSRGARSRR
jgi:membrane-associated phospholipid phosphatase